MGAAMTDIDAEAAESHSFPLGVCTLREKEGRPIELKQL
jgi:hypothetical protein